MCSCLCVWVRVSMYACLGACMYVGACQWVNLWMSLWIRVWVRVCRSVCMCARVWVCVCLGAWV